ncbi:MAG: tetratricopeptide repeat protein [Chthoniobacterales bacterium]|nr:tetratricopeptide repeat protein [Chthoniobacterales bacterium]
MQLVSAFSPPQTVPAVPAAAPKTNLWILNSWRDLILYVGTPLLLIPMFALAQARWSAQDIYVFVAAFGAMGHHLPGMIRAYGDRALFERFRWRFIFAPIFLVAVCIAFTWWGLKGIILAVFFWGVWHGMMQTYGFCRIYDAKLGSFAPLTRRLDLATCAVWFATAVLLSSERMTDTLETYYASGGPYIAPWFLHGAQQVMLFGAITVSVLFIVNFSWMWARGKRPNPVKLALLVTSIGFWWFCNNGVTNILAGIALFEVFHDVQYLSLVWIYNRNRVEKDSSIGGFMRFIFRRSGSLVGLYIGLVFAYGALGYFNERLQVDTIKRALTGVVAASGLLHFYYDGFIWKVRERSTRESLGLTGGVEAAGAKTFMPSWLLHGFKWVAIFVIPLGALWIGQTRGPAPEAERNGWVVADLPTGATQRFDYAGSLAKAGRHDEAIQQYQIGLGFDPNDGTAHYSLATLLLSKSKVDEAAGHIEQSLRLDPHNGEFRSNYAYLLESLGRKNEAVGHYEAATRLSPKSAKVRYNYAMFLAREGKLDQAIVEFQEAVRNKPDYADAECDLATALYQKGDLESAKTHFLETVRLDPKRATAYNNLGTVYFRQGHISQAITQFNEALRVQPQFQAAVQNLQRASEEASRLQAGGSTPP